MTDFYCLQFHKLLNLMLRPAKRSKKAEEVEDEDEYEEDEVEDEEDEEEDDSSVSEDNSSVSEDEADVSGEEIVSNILMHLFDPIFETQIDFSNF